MKTYVAICSEGYFTEITYAGTSEDKAISSIVNCVEHRSYGIVEVWEDDNLVDAFEVKAK